MTTREAVEKLFYLRIDYQNRVRSAEETKKLGKEASDTLDDLSREKAKKYGVRPKLINNRIINYPTRLFK